MKVICERCGQYSNHLTVCSNCGANIHEIDHEGPSLLPPWGWGTFEIPQKSSEDSEALLDFLLKEWNSLERLTVQALLPSQTSKFKRGASFVRVLGRKDFLNSVFENARLQFNHAGYSFESVEPIEDAEINKLVLRNLP